MLNRLTIDLEDWYHPLEPAPSRWPQYESRIVQPTLAILDLIATANTKATFFVLGDVARNHPDLIREIHRQGHEVASHGMDHRFVYDQAPDDFRRDVASSIELLTSITGAPIIGYRAPYFSITNRSLWSLSILQELGIRYDSSIFPVINHRYGIASAPRTPYRLENGMMEFPVATYPVGSTNIPIGGGVYFRVFPYAALRWALRRLNARREEFVFYLHPWECDPEQPRIRMSPGLRLRHYWKLDQTLAKLGRLMREFTFGPLGGTAS